MNVRQLRNLLLDYPDDLEILLASDPEGNGFYRMVEMGVSYIYMDDDKYGSVEDLYGEDLQIEDEPMEPRLVFWP